MSDIGGLKNRLAWVPEDTWGTDPGSGYLVAGQIQGDPVITADNKTIESKEAGLRLTRALVEGTFECGVKFDFYVQDGAFLIAALGDYDTTSPVTNTDNYIHFGGTNDSTATQASPVEYEPKAMTVVYGLELGGTDDVLTMVGGKVDSLTLTLNLNEPLKASVDIFGKKFSPGTSSPTLTYIEDGPWMFHNKGAITLDGDTVTDLTDLSVTIANNMKRNFGIAPASDRRCVTSITAGQTSITGTITLNYDQKTELEKFLSDSASPTGPSDSGTTEFDISVLLDNEETETTADYRGIKLELLGCKFNTFDRTSPQDGSAVNEKYALMARKAKVSYYNDTSSDKW